jgi:Tol biopolymer transport system component/DNA-binding winged helix-turn-helix (wHTH) protein
MQAKDELETGEYYHFDGYTLDPDRRTLKNGNTLVDLTPKVFTTLLVLVKNRDKLLTKDELLTIIWPDQFVDQSNLSQNISVLRKSLGETETGKKYIATFPGHGYRFVGQVEVRHHNEDDRAALPPDPPSPAANASEAAPVHMSRNSRTDSSKSIPRYWNFASIVTSCVVILVVILAFAIRENGRHSKLVSIAEDNAPVKLYARMNAGLTQPSWSRDGKTIAFVAMDLSGTGSTIYVQLKGDIQPHSVVEDSGQYSSPAWSPDSKRLAFLHFEPGTADIVIYDIQRKSSRVLTRLFPRRYGLNYRHLDWSPDGKFLVVDDKSRDSEPFSLYLIYIDSGQRVPLTYPDSDMIGDISPRVSPDGTEVAFIRDIDFFEQDVYITSVRGRTYQRITSAHTLISDVGWKTDKILAFAADHGDGFRFWQLDLTKRDEKETMASRVDFDRALQFSVSQNGQMVAFSNYSPDLGIWSIDAAKPSDRWVPVIQAPGENIRPSVSPDGKLLAFLSNIAGEFQIWVSQIDGTNASAVSTGTLVPASFCWSSDGKSLLFSPQGVHGIYEVSVHGGASVTQISSIYTDPQYATDGKSLFARAHFFIYRIPLPGGDPKEVTEQGGAPIAQSQDGRYLYFPQGRMSTTIARLDLQSGHQDELTSSLVPGYSDAWALSSRGIFFLGQENNQPAVRFFNFADGREEHIADFPADLPQVEMSGFGISPDGKRLWVVRADPMPSDMETTMFRSD